MFQHDKNKSSSHTDLKNLLIDIDNMAVRTYINISPLIILT